MRKEKIKGNNKIWCCLIFETLFLTILYLRFVGQYKGFFLSEDELGYWGSAAKLAGLDWGNVLEGTSYYSYGYSLVLALLLKLPLKPLYIYRVAVGLNAIYILISFYIAFYVFTHLFPNKSKYYISLACMVGLCYSSYVTQSALSWPELFLVMILWLIILQVYLLCEKLTIVRLAIFIVEIIYIYIVHMRTLSVVFAGVAFLMLFGLKNKHTFKMMLVAIVSIALLFVLSNVIKNVFQAQVYNVSSTFDVVNDYSSILGTKFSIDTVIGFFLSSLGQLYGLIVSSYGLFIVGIVSTIVYGLKRWKEKDTKAFLFGFVTIVFFGAWFISAFFLKWSVASRYDVFFYSRYLDNTISFFIILGILEIGTNSSRNTWKLYSTVFLLSLFVAVVSVSFRVRVFGLPNTYYQGVCAPGMYLWFKLFGVSLSRITGILIFFICIIFILMKLGNNCFSGFKYISLALILGLWIFGGHLVIKDQILPYENLNIKELADAEDLFQSINSQNCTVSFFSSKKNCLRGSVQFYLMDMPIKYVQTWKAAIEGQPDIIIIDKEEVCEGEQTNKCSQYELIDCIGEMTVWKNVDKKELQFGDIMDRLGYSYMKPDETDADFVVYGPYVTLPAGKYCVTYELIIDDDEKRKNEKMGFVDICSNQQQLKIEECIGSQNKYILDFNLSEPTKNMEFRIYKNNEKAVKVEAIRIGLF